MNSKNRFSVTLSLVLFGAVAGLAASSAQADKYGMAGCGLGSLVFEGKPGKIQILAATTNGTFGSQTFGITTGTSNCTEDSRDYAKMYLLINREALAKDVSRGTGESIDGLAKVYGCESTQDLAAALKQNYNTIFPNASSQSEEMHQAIENTIRADRNLADHCRIPS